MTLEPINKEGKERMQVRKVTLIQFPVHNIHNIQCQFIFQHGLKPKLFLKTFLFQKPGIGGIMLIVLCKMLLMIELI